MTDSRASRGNTKRGWGRAALRGAFALVALGISLNAPHDDSGRWRLSLASADCTTGSSQDSISIYSPQRFTHYGSSSLWNIYDDTFTADTVTGWRYVVELVKGSPGVSNAIVDINGKQFVGSSDLTSGRILRTIDVAPGENILGISVKGSNESWMDVRIVRVKDPTFTVGIVSSDTTLARAGSSVVHAFPFYVSTITDTVTCTMRVVNGLPNGTHRVTTGALYVNGIQVLSSSDFGSGKAVITRQVMLYPTDSLRFYNQNDTSQVTVRFRQPDRTAPLDSLATPAVNPYLTTASFVLATGTVTDQTPGWLRVNSRPPIVTPGAFNDSIPLLADGHYVLSIQTINSACLFDTLTRHVYRDTQPPSFPTLSPADNTTGSSDSISVVGTWADTTRTYVTVNGDTVAVGKGGSFSTSVPLDLGSNRIYVGGVDQLGHETLITRHVWRSPTACSGCDTSGRAATVLTATEVASFRNQIGFLFRGSSHIQTGADTTKILTGAESVIRGFVAGRDYDALPGVTVSVLGHPEFGSTKSLNDGWFDLAVTGGATYTLRFKRDDFLEAQRQVLALALDYAVMDTVAMIGRSATWSYVDTSAVTRIVSRFESDSSGSRRMYVVIPNGDLATITPSGGTPITGVSKYRVRLKEFTVGSGGPATMPGDLPAATAYTYCVDMSLVEADSITDHAGPGALPASVSFSKPIVTYVKNFIGLPVGTVMPSGYYDPASGRWIADENGKIIKVLSTDGGVASLDTDGNGVADTLAQYTAMGIDTLELTQMGALFRPGDALWRDRVSHFTAHDFNLNTIARTDSINAASAGTGTLNIGDPEKTCACVIENENRVLGESIPVKGTPFSLNYRSSRQFGDIAGRWLRIPLTGAVMPVGLQRVRLQVDVAGRRYQAVYTGITSNDVRFFSDWDGTDAYGRRVPGSVTATVRLGYEFQQSFALKTNHPGGFGDAASTPSGNGLFTTGDRNLPSIEWTTQKVSIGAPSMASAGLGGWTLSPHHFSDVNGRGALYLGDGSVRYGLQQYPIIKRFAGTGVRPGSAPDTTAFRTLVPIAPSDLAFGPDGSLFFIGMIGTTHHVVYRLRPNGTIILWAGCALCNESDPNNDPQDGALAVSTTKRLAGPNGLAVGPDGSVYISDGVWRQVYRITPDDTLHVVSGKYSLGYGGFVEGAIAKTHALSSPSAVGVGPDGSVYISDHGYRRVVRIGTDGLMHSFAGDSCCVSATSGKADSIMLRSNLDVTGIAVSPRGEVYLTDGDFVWLVTPDGQARRISGPDHGVTMLALGPGGELYIGAGPGYNGVVRRETDGTLSTIAGTYLDYQFGDFVPADFAAEEGGFAKAARMAGMGGVAVGPDGNVYVGQVGASGSGGYGIRVISTEVPGQLNNEIAYPSEDGRQVFYFTPTGRHKRTEDVTTGVTLYAFDYDGAGRLIRVRDANGDTTTIQRGSDGVPLAIVGPYGQRTTLSLDGNGYLSQATDSLAGEAYQLDYTSGGLLLHIMNPRGKTQTFTYNSDDGRLHYDEDAAGARQTLGNTDGGLTQTVTRTTQEGRVTTYQVTRMLDGLRRRLVSYPSHGVSYRADSMNTSTPPYGDVTREVGVAGDITLTYPTRDHRYGMLAKVPVTAYTILPSGLRRTETASRDTALGGVVTETAGLNGHTFTTTYTKSTKTLLTTSPTGRTRSATLDAAGRPVSVSAGSSVAPKLLGYDAHGRLTALTQGGRGWRYSYDGSGRLRVVRDTLGRMTTYGYDSADRDSSEVMPGSRTVSYGYDANGNLTSLTPPGGSAHTFGYNDVDLTGTYTPPSVAGITDPATRYTFNGDRRLTLVSRPDGTLIRARYSSTTGLLDSLTQARGRHTYTYAANGQLSTAGSPDGVTVSYGYDGPLLRSEAWSGLFGGGAVESVSVRSNIAFADSVQTINGSSPASYAYDNDGLVTGVTVNSTTETISRRSDDGLISGTSISNVTSLMSYNSHGELWKLSYSWPGGGSFQQVLDRDSLGRIVKVTESGISAHTYDYHYDAGARLDSVAMDGIKVAGYTYDANGNRTAFRGATSSDTATATYDAQDRMVRYGRASYAYTANGELMRRIGPSADTTRYTYDALGNLTGAHLSSGDSLVYLIDGGNRRVGRVLNNTRTNLWLYQNALNVIAELDTSGSIVNRYVYGTQGHVPDLMVLGGNTYRVVTDQLGSVRALVHVSSGTLIQQMDYDAWGVRATDTAPRLQPLGYTGGLSDSLTGLVRFGARDYSPAIARWVSKDVVRFGGGSSNLYEYVASQPSDFIDPWGFDYITPDQGRKIPGAAQKWSGTPYKSGGKSREGADCSGAVWGIYGEAGFPYPYSPSAGFPGVPNFQPAPGNIPQPGDIGWWNGHMVIYDPDASRFPNADPKSDTWSARRRGRPFGPAPLDWFSKDRGPVTWYRYYLPDGSQCQCPRAGK